MPLSCLDERGVRIQAFDLSDEGWSALQARNRRDSHLRTTCCLSAVVMKRSSRGTRFFSHKQIGPCLTADETEEHRQLKLLAVEAARACGWQAETEVAGCTPAGEQWRADVLATKGAAKVAVEVQWSGQIDDETIRRQQRYWDSGIRGLWLLRQPGFPLTEELPAVCIGGNLSDGFTALLPHEYQRVTRQDRAFPDRWRQAVSMRDLLEAAFGKRLKWGRPLEVFGQHVEISVKAAEALCWGDSCGVLTDIITHVIIANPGMELKFTLADLSGFSEITNQVMAQLPVTFDHSHIKPRYSQMMRRNYLSNGCVGCNRLFGDHFLFQYLESESVVARFPIDLVGDWLTLAQSDPDDASTVPEWWVIPPS